MGLMQIAGLKSKTQRHLCTVDIQENDDKWLSQVSVSSCHMGIIGPGSCTKPQQLSLWQIGFVLNS